MNFLAIFQRLRQMIVDLWQRTEKRDRNRFFVISGASFIVIVIALVMLTRTPYVPLTVGKGTTEVEQAEIMSALSSQNYKPKRDSNGNISVPEKKHGEAYLYLVSNGIPGSGSTQRNTDMYSLGTGLTSNAAGQEQYRMYQLEQDLQILFRNIDGIRDSLVLLASASGQRTSPLRGTQITPSASVMLITDDPAIVPSSDIVAMVKAATAGAVAGLEPEKVAVSYQGGLLRDDAESVYEGIYKDRIEMKKQIELDLEQGVGTLLAPWAGRDDFRVMASATLNWDAEVENILEYTPSIDDEFGVIESSQTLNEIAEGFGDYPGIPGMDDNGGGDLYAEVENPGRNYYERNEQILNYKVNEMSRYVEKAQGTIENLSIAVTVRDTAPGAGDANFVRNLQTLIGNAIGLHPSLHASRVTVEFMEFAGKAAEEAARQQFIDEQKSTEIMELIRIIALYIVIGVCVVLLILKTYGLLKKEPTEEELLAGAIEDGYDPELDEVAALVEMATLGEITEAAKSPFREQVEKFIDQNPDAVADLLRNWLREDG